MEVHCRNQLTLGTSTLPTPLSTYFQTFLWGTLYRGRGSAWGALQGVVKNSNEALVKFLAEKDVCANNLCGWAGMPLLSSTELNSSLMTHLFAGADGSIAGGYSGGPPMFNGDFDLLEKILNNKEVDVNRWNGKY